jgi:hypothetical protein
LPDNPSGAITFTSPQRYTKGHIHTSPGLAETQAGECGDKARHCGGVGHRKGQQEILRDIELAWRGSRKEREAQGREEKAQSGSP